MCIATSVEIAIPICLKRVALKEAPRPVHEKTDSGSAQGWMAFERVIRTIHLMQQKNVD
jgi:hypothetical protein